MRQRVPSNPALYMPTCKKSIVQIFPNDNGTMVVHVQESNLFLAASKNRENRIEQIKNAWPHEEVQHIQQLLPLSTTLDLTPTTIPKVWLPVRIVKSLREGQSGLKEAYHFIELSRYLLLLPHRRWCLSAPYCTTSLSVWGEMVYDLPWIWVQNVLQSINTSWRWLELVPETWRGNWARSQHRWWNR